MWCSRLHSPCSRVYSPLIIDHVGVGLAGGARGWEMKGHRSCAVVQHQHVQWRVLPQGTSSPALEQWECCRCCPVKPRPLHDLLLVATKNEAIQWSCRQHLQHSHCSKTRQGLDRACRCPGQVPQQACQRECVPMDPTAAVSIAGCHQTHRRQGKPISVTLTDTPGLPGTAVTQSCCQRHIQGGYSCLFCPEGQAP